MDHNTKDSHSSQEDNCKFLLPQASYYLLFKRAELAKASSSAAPKIASQEEQADGDGTADIKDDLHQDANTSCSKANDFWEEFEWSEEEISKVKDTLHHNKSKCDIGQNVRGDFLIRKLEENASKNWDKFYQDHQTNFFKDRHYLEKAFPEFQIVYGNQGNESKSTALIDRNEMRDGDECRVEQCSGDFTIVEIGCGVGNTMLPLLELDHRIYVPEKTSKDIDTYKRMVVWGLDFSSVAIDLLKQDERFIAARRKSRSHAAVWDITSTHPRDIHQDGELLESTSDISLLLFCLSAVSPQKMKDAAINAVATLKPGGTLILRDYGRYDEAQLKLGTSRGKCLEDNFYVKHDGTRCYYFELDELKSLFVDEAGMEVVELKYIQRLYRNRAADQVRRRVWVQGRFKKPL